MYIQKDGEIFYQLSEDSYAQIESAAKSLTAIYSMLFSMERTGSVNLADLANLLCYPADSLNSVLKQLDD